MSGKVYLVGAGPGDPQLITVKAEKILKKAQVLVYDRLANPVLTALAGPECEKIYVGKASKEHTLGQAQINRLLVEKAQAGLQVVRLKGGDPYVFGRGGEEALELEAAQIEFEVVPGITAGIGGLCYAGIPITQRGYATSLHLITGHLREEEEDSKEINFPALSALPGTLVFYMGVKNLGKIVRGLIQHGKSPLTPAAVITWATLPQQRVITGTLQDIEQKAALCEPPSLIVVGEVVKLREQLAFFERKPLFGKTIAITRARVQASALREQLEELGACVLESPAIVIEPCPLGKEQEKMLEGLASYTHLLFTSQNAVQLFFNHLFARQKDARALSHLTIASIGQVTTRELQRFGVRADLEAPTFVAESLLEILRPTLFADSKVLLPRAQEARDLLPEKIGQFCTIDILGLYRTHLQPIEPALLDALEHGEIDYVTFTSASTVRNFVGSLEEVQRQQLQSVTLLSIGPVTSEALQSFGFKKNVLEAAPHTVQALVDTTLTHALARKKITP